MENCQHPVIVLQTVVNNQPPLSRRCTVCNQRFPVNLPMYIADPNKITVTYPKDAA